MPLWHLVSLSVHPAGMSTTPPPHATLSSGHKCSCTGRAVLVLSTLQPVSILSELQSLSWLTVLCLELPVRASEQFGRGPCHSQPWHSC